MGGVTMVERLELEEILTLNPQIDRQMLEQAMDLLRKIRESSIGRPGYNLASPYARRYTSIGGDTEPDPRTAHVGRRSKG